MNQSLVSVIYRRWRVGCCSYYQTTTMAVSTDRHIRREYCSRYQGTIAGPHIDTKRWASAVKVVVKPWAISTFDSCAIGGLKKADVGTLCFADFAATSFHCSIVADDKNASACHLERRLVWKKNGHVVDGPSLVLGYNRKRLVVPYPGLALFEMIPLLIGYNYWPSDWKSISTNPQSLQRLGHHTRS